MELDADSEAALAAWSRSVGVGGWRARLGLAGKEGRGFDRGLGRARKSSGRRCFEDHANSILRYIMYLDTSFTLYVRAYAKNVFALVLQPVICSVYVRHRPYSYDVFENMLWTKGSAFEHIL